MPKSCLCPGCPNIPTQGRECFSCWGDRRDGKPHEPRHPWSCALPPCDGRLTTDDPVHHYVKVWHSDPDGDDPKALREMGLRTIPKDVSPMESFSGR